jgi:hypothetical protein
MKLPWRIVLIGGLIATLAAAALGPRPPAAHAQAGSLCAELIQNGGFETNAAWILGKDPIPPQYVTYAYHTPGRSMALGIVQGANKNSYSSVRQQVTISPAAEQVRLSFWFYPKFVNSTPATDWVQLLLLFPDGTNTPLWDSFNTSQTWNPMQFDLSQYRGRTFTVYFNVHNDGLGGTAGMLLDDVSLTACSVATSTSTSVPATATPTLCAPACPATPAPCLLGCPATLTPTRTPTRTRTPTVCPPACPTTPAPCLLGCPTTLTPWPCLLGCPTTLTPWPCLPGCPATLTPTRTPTRTRTLTPSPPVCAATSAPCYATSTPASSSPTVRPHPTGRTTGSPGPADMTARALATLDPAVAATGPLEPADMTARAATALGPMPLMTHVALEGAPSPSRTPEPTATRTPAPALTPTPALQPSLIERAWNSFRAQSSGLACVAGFLILAFVAFLLVRWFILPGSRV